MTTPRGWARTTLGALGRYVNGRGFKKSEWATSGRPIIRIQNLTGTSDHFNYYRGNDVPDDQVARSGDLLISWAATLGAYLWDGPEAVINQHIFKVDSLIDVRFHRYLLDHKLSALMRETHGSGMVHITRHRFEAIPVDLPPPTEQRRIVEILEDHMSRLDSAALSVSLARRRLVTLTSSLRDAAVSGGSGAVEPGAELPHGWLWVPIEKLADSARGSMTIGPFGSNLKVVDYREAGVPLVFVRNVRTGSFAEDGQRFVTPEKAQELRAHQVALGDVVVTKMGDPPGDAAVYDNPVPGVVTADVIRIRPGQGVDPHYLALALNSTLVRRQIGEITRGVAQQKVSLARYRAVLVPVPDRAMQVTVVSAYQSQADRLSRLAAEIHAAETRAPSLRRSLLAAAFAGRLTGQTSATDPIEEFTRVCR